MTEIQHRSMTKRSLERRLRAALNAQEQRHETRLGTVLEYAARMAEKLPPKGGPSDSWAARRRRERRVSDARYDAGLRQRGFFAAMMKTTKSAPARVARFVAMTGLTPSEMRAHIESQFGLGMSWANRAAWHIDHKKPCCSFDLLKPADVRKCWNWRNLRPLMGDENQGKAGRDKRMARTAASNP